ncbi:sarcosine oxidase subunit delta [Ruegeria sp. A3M17]|uniref:sarcosine oxidase subunit delta n=1 Tax=Ruegeria sp. A3M17 TaxID=2267229 RepID=UPI000DEA4444|nr:sarcosine oxidase subunit delta [Ruegeria sp. A3M17]RBW53484.1 sarcosine oxidase subunit delta [Ruegeria sp. A3M17]
MMNITCPFCGKRNESEFIHGGPVGAVRPDPNAVSDEEWVEYLTVTPNPLGPVQEKWWHARGCGEWFSIWRDTRTHDIVEAPDGTT